MCCHRLAEADAGVDGNARAIDAELGQAREPVGEVVDQVAGHVGVARVLLHGLRLAQHMHQHDGGTRLRGDTRAIGITGQRSHVVDDGGTRRHRLPHHRSMTRVDGYDGAGLAQRPHHGQHARGLVLRRDRRGAWPGGFTADVDDVGAGRQHGPAVVDRCRRIGEIAAVGETVRRHVQNAHDQRPLQIEAGPGRARLRQRGEDFGREVACGIEVERPSHAPLPRFASNPVGQRESQESARQWRGQAGSDARVRRTLRKKCRVG